jgi:hypothetical protein
MKLAKCIGMGLVLSLVVATVSHVGHTFFDMGSIRRVPPLQCYLTSLGIGIFFGPYLFVVANIKAEKFHSKAKMAVANCLLLWFVPVSFMLLYTIFVLGVSATLRIIVIFYVLSIICALPIMIGLVIWAKKQSQY